MNIFFSNVFANQHFSTIMESIIIQDILKSQIKQKDEIIGQLTKTLAECLTSLEVLTEMLEESKPAECPTCSHPSIIYKKLKEDHDIYYKYASKNYKFYDELGEKQNSCVQCEQKTCGFICFDCLMDNFEFSTKGYRTVLILKKTSVNWFRKHAGKYFYKPHEFNPMTYIVHTLRATPLLLSMRSAHGRS